MHSTDSSMINVCLKILHMKIYSLGSELHHVRKIAFFLPLVVYCLNIKAKSGWYGADIFTQKFLDYCGFSSIIQASGK